MRRNILSAKSMLVLLVLALPCLVAGCASSLVGDWKIENAPPSDELYISHIRFRDDGSYTGVARVKGQDPVLLDGNYNFNGFKLRLKRLGKQDHVYPATFIVGGKLQIRDGSTQYMLKKQ